MKRVAISKSQPGPIGTAEECHLPRVDWYDVQQWQYIWEAVVGRLRGDWLGKLAFDRLILYHTWHEALAVLWSPPWREPDVVIVAGEKELLVRPHLRAGAEIV